MTLIVLFFCTFTVLSTGCDQEPQVTDFKEMLADKPMPSAPEMSDETDYKSMSTFELGNLADKALGENNIETVAKALDEIRTREKLTGAMKMEIARVLFGSGAMKDSARVYDEVLEASPESKKFLWQRGLALYYAEEFQKGVEQFESHQTYNSQDVENSVWHLLCQSRLTSVDEAREKMILIEQDSRVPMKQVFDMFAGTGSPEKVLEACKYDEGDPKPDSAIYHGLIYIGLFHEMMGDQKASNESMKEALKFVIPGRGLMSHVAEGHLRARKAYPVDRDAR
jgi:lipoprotein NlpI